MTPIVTNFMVAGASLVGGGFIGWCIAHEYYRKQKWDSKQQTDYILQETKTTIEQELGKYRAEVNTKVDKLSSDDPVLQEEKSALRSFVTEATGATMEAIGNGIEKAEDVLFGKRGTVREKFKYGYAWEKLYVGMRSLAGSGTIQDRLIAAWRSGIYLLRNRDNLPDEVLYDELNKICDALTAKEDPTGGREGKLTATVVQMSDDEAEEWARRILSLYDNVTRLHAVQSKRGMDRR